jgi:hypothetical protein
MIRRRVLTILETIRRDPSRGHAVSYRARVRHRLLTGLLVAMLALAACGSGDDVEGAEATAGDTGVRGGTAEPTTPEGATELLSFEAETIDGGSVDVGEYAGSDLVIWFWAPW